MPINSRRSVSLDHPLYFPMISGKVYPPTSTSCISRPTHIRSPLYPPIFKNSRGIKSISSKSISPFSPSFLSASFPVFVTKPSTKFVRVSNSVAKVCSNKDESPTTLSELEDLSENGVVYKKTLALVECSMFAALSGLVYFLSYSLALENYFGCFFCLPIVISSMRWGIAAGRKTMVATFFLLLVLSGPVKALIYLIRHGFVGFIMGSLWRLGANWSTSIFLCTIVRALGAVGYVLLGSFLISENILALITINIHASLTLILTAWGVNLIPSMNVIYAIFGTLVLLNCGCFIFLLHLLYSVFLTRLGMKTSLTLPRWLEKAM